MISTIVVANGFNTSYLDSLLVAMFYKSSHLRSFLTQYPEKSKFIYLQELINNNFINTIKNGYSVDTSIINEIRNYSIVCGWKEGENIADLYSVIDYMKFLMHGIGFGQIDFEFIEFNEFNNIENEKVKTMSMNYIDTIISENTNVKILLEKWYETNIKKPKTSNEHFRILCNKFKEIPLMIPIFFNREKGTSYNVDIKKKIKFKKNNDSVQNNVSWIIHALICFSSFGSGSYYSIINTDVDKWFLFSNEKIPSLIEIKIYDPEISNKIKQECILAIYRLDNLCKL